MTKFNGFQHDGFGGFRATAFNARNGGEMYYVGQERDIGSNNIIRVYSFGGSELLAVQDASVSGAFWVIPDAAGNFYANTGSIRKFNAAGTELWGTAGNALAGATNAAGDLLVTLNTITLQCKRYNTSGTPDQEFTLTVEDNNRLAIDGSGNIYTFGQGADGDDLLAKYNAAGTEQWIVDPGGGIPRAISVGTNDDLVVGMLTTSGPTDTVEHYDLDGNFDWSYDPAGSPTVSAVSLHTDGTCAVGLSPSSGSDDAVLKLTAAGGLAWGYSTGYTGQHHVDVGESGRVYVASRTGERVFVLSASGDLIRTHALGYTPYYVTAGKSTKVGR